jgi:HK97 family phage major capsid protein
MSTATEKKTKKGLEASFRQTYGEVKSLRAKRDAGDITPEEVERLKELATSVKSLREEIDNFDDGSDVEDELAEIDEWANRPATDPPPTAVKSVTRTRVEGGESEHDKFMKRGPFKSMGHYLYVVQQAGERPGMATSGTLGLWNERVRAHDVAVKSLMPEVKSAAGLNELFDSEGGSLVPPEFSNRVWERVAGDPTNLLGLCDQTPVSGNGYSMAAWNDKSRTGDLLYGGARAYWGPEAGEKTSSRPATRMISWRLNKLYVLMYATDELLEDTTALESRLAAIAAQNFTYMINKAIITGSGVGQPLGILNSAAKITNAAVSGQGANTIIGANVTSMYSRRAPGSSSRLVWLYNTDIEPQLDQLNFTVAGTNSIAAQWMYLPTGGLRDNPEPRLKGRPMIESEHCPALGTEGDLILFDPTAYGAIVKSTGIQGAVSMHVRFVYDETAFRWVFRMDGRPFWDDVLTPANGATKAPIVTLNSSRA